MRPSIPLDALNKNGNANSGNASTSSAIMPCSSSDAVPPDGFTEPITFAATTEAENTSMTIGNNNSILMSSSHHFLKYFSVFGRIQAANASGATMTSSTMMAFRAAIVKITAKNASRTGMRKKNATMAMRPAATTILLRSLTLATFSENVLPDVADTSEDTPTPRILLTSTNIWHM